MTPTQTALRKAEQSLSDIEKRAAALVASDSPNPAKLKELAAEKVDAIETRTALETLCQNEERESVVVRPTDHGADSETREKRRLRSKARIGHFLAAKITGNALAGESREYRSSLNLESGIPLDLFELPREERADTVTPIPTSNAGVNLRPVMPAIFARSVMPRLGVAMPRVQSGAYSIPVITTDLTAAAVAKGTAQESSAGAITAKATTPHRVSARLSIAIEDVAQFGNNSFESALRQNLMLAMSDRLDRLGLTGDNSGANPQGLLSQLTNPDDATTVADFDAFVELAADGIDGGPWAESMMDVRLLVNADTMQLAEKAFQQPKLVTNGTAPANSVGAGAVGDMSAAAYLRKNSGGFMASSRMPDTASDIAQALRYRAGTMGLDGVNAMETATCPVWASLSIDDIYSDAASGERHVTLHALIGDVIINYASAYDRVDLKVS